MVFHSVSLGPTEGQLADLASGEKVLLSHKHLKGQKTLRLTSTQAKKVENAIAAGRGVTLQFSASQLKHNVMGGHIGSGIAADLAKVAYEAVKPALKGVARTGLKAGTRAAANLANKGVEKGRELLQDKLESMFGLQGSGLFMGTSATPTQMRKLEQWHAQRGSGFLSGLLGSFGLGIGPGHKTFAEQRGKGWLGSLLRKGAHGLVDVVGDIAGGHVGKKGKGFLSNLLRKGAHGLVDVVGDIAGGNVRPNPLANPNEGLAAAMYKKKTAIF